MFREIRTSERITDQDERKKRELIAIFDKRISDETIKELNEFWVKEFERAAETFDPDNRIMG